MFVRSKKLSLSVFIFAISILSYTAIAQPEQHGCHHVHNQVKLRPMTDAERIQYRASMERSDSFDVLHYNIHLDLTDQSNRQLHGRTTVDFSPKMANLDYIPLDLLSLTIDSVFDQDGNQLSWDRTGFYTRVFMNEVMLVGNEYSVEIYYHGSPTVSSANFGGFYFDGPYMYNLGINLNGMPHNFGRSWFPCFDNFVERSTYTIQIKTHAGNDGFAIGDYLGTIFHGGDTITNTYHMDQQLPTYLVGVAAGPYTTFGYTHQGLEKNIPVLMVAFAQDTSNMRSSLAEIANTIDGLEYWFGPYEWNQVGYVITTRGAMEHSTMIAYPINSITNGEESLGLMAHELAHHWWGNYVTVNYAPDMWIKEGNAEYGEHLVRGFIDPEGFPEVVRANHYYVMTTAHKDDGAYLALSPLSQENTYGTHTYYKGAAMMHNLHAYLGDSLYRAANRTVLQGNAYSYLNAETFKKAFSDASGIDLTDFFDDWIYGKGWSDFSVEYFSYDAQNDSVDVVVKQGLFHAEHLHQSVPLRLTFYDEDGNYADARVYVGGASSDVRIKSPIQDPTSVSVNRANHLNLGMYEYFGEIVEPGNYNDKYTLQKLVISKLDEPMPFAIEHHLSAPSDPFGTTNFQLSKNHFWHLAGVLDEGTQGTLRLTYDKGGALELDPDLVSHSEDSLVLMYRPDALHAWEIYPYYNKIALSTKDGIGSILIDSLMLGDFTFANDLRDPIGIKDQQIEEVFLSIAPNPISDYIQIEIAHEHWASTTYYQIINTEGKIINEGEMDLNNLRTLDVSNLVSGNYHLYLNDKNGLYAQAQFVVGK